MFVPSDESAYEDEDFGVSGLDFSPENWQDSAVLKAKKEIKEIFKQAPQSVFYHIQLEVKLEKNFFHWVTHRAIKELIGEGFLIYERKPLFIGKNTSVLFVFMRKNRYYKHKVKRYLKIIQEYSDPDIAKACGEQAEILFTYALLKRGFRLIGEDINEFQGKKWIETNHNLDFIMEKDGLSYGCEVKNTFGYIEKEELEIKMKICEHLGLIPLFIMRASPKDYNNTIIKRGGFVLIFETQIYPLGQEKLVKKIKEILGLPALCSRAIPDGIINRFMRFHDKKCEFFKSH